MGGAVHRGPAQGQAAAAAGGYRHSPHAADGVQVVEVAVHGGIDAIHRTDVAVLPEVIAQAAVCGGVVAGDPTAVILQLGQVEQVAQHAGAAIVVGGVTLGLHRFQPGQGGGGGLGGAETLNPAAGDLFQVIDHRQGNHILIRLQQGQRPRRLLLRLLHCQGLGEVVNTHRDTGVVSALDVFLKIGVLYHVEGVRGAGITAADEDKGHPIGSDGFPVDLRLPVGHVDAHQHNAVREAAFMGVGLPGVGADGGQGAGRSQVCRHRCRVDAALLQHAVVHHADVKGIVLRGGGVIILDIFLIVVLYGVLAQVGCPQAGRFFAFGRQPKPPQRCRHRRRANNQNAQGCAEPLPLFLFFHRSAPFPFKKLPLL